MTFEQTLVRLEEIAAALDRSDLTLEQALALFEEGIAKLREAQLALTVADGQVRTLVEEAEGIFEVQA